VTDERIEALIHLLLHRVETLVHGIEALVHLLDQGLDQLALVLELLLYAHHALAQLDLIDRRRLAERLLREPTAEVVFDELDVFLRQGHVWCGVMSGLCAAA